MSNIVPDGWVCSTVGDLARRVKPGPFGSSLTKSMYVSSGFKIYGQEQVIAGDVTVGSYYIDREKFDELSAFKVEAGDILISLVGTFGRILIVPEGFHQGIINPRLLLLRFTRDSFDIIFVAQQLQSELVITQLKLLQQGGTMGVLSATTLKPVKLNVPPLPEQQKIAAILSSVDDVIEKTQAQIDKLKDLKTGMMQELLTKGIGHTEFKDSPVGRIPVEWDVVPLEGLSSFVTSGSRGWAQYYSDSGAIFIRIGNLTRENINFRFKDIVYVNPPNTAEGKRTLVQEGDVLISITADLGVIAVVNDSVGKAYVNQHVALVRLDSPELARWVGHYLAFEDSQKQFTANNDAGAKAGLNLTAIRKTLVSVPDDKERKTIVDSLDSVDGLIADKRRSLQQKVDIKKALMQDLLTGKIRVNVNE